MNKKELVFAFYRFHWIWKFLIGLCTICIFIIGTFSESPEIMSFGYESGIILMPIVTSIFVSLILFFFTSHFQESSRKMEAINRFDDFRDSIIEVLRFCQNESDYKGKTPTFFETNLFELYDINLSQSAIEKGVWIENHKRRFILANWIGILIGTIVFIQKSSSFNSLDEKYYNKIVVFHLARKALIKDKDHNAFLKNLIYCLSDINKLITLDYEYKLVYKLRFNKNWESSELRNKVSISY